MSDLRPWSCSYCSRSLKVKRSLVGPSRNRRSGRRSYAGQYDRNSQSSQSRSRNYSPVRSRFETTSSRESDSLVTHIRRNYSDWPTYEYNVGSRVKSSLRRRYCLKSLVGLCGPGVGSVPRFRSRPSLSLLSLKSRRRSPGWNGHSRQCHLLPYESERLRLLDLRRHDGLLHDVGRSCGVSSRRVWSSLSYANA